jgi:hypothetical protein
VIKLAECGILILEWKCSVLMATRMIYFHVLLIIVEILLLQAQKIILAEFGEILIMGRMSRIVH